MGWQIEPLERKSDSILIREECSEDEDDVLENADSQDDEFEDLLEDTVPQHDCNRDDRDRNFILGKDEETIWTKYSSTTKQEVQSTN